MSGALDRSSHIGAPMSIVSIASCECYQLEAVRRAVMAALAPLGGIERFVHPGMRVLLKPNLVSALMAFRCILVIYMEMQLEIRQVLNKSIDYGNRYINLYVLPG